MKSKGEVAAAGCGHNVQWRKHVLLHFYYYDCSGNAKAGARFLCYYYHHHIVLQPLFTAWQPNSTSPSALLMKDCARRILTFTMVLDCIWCYPRPPLCRICRRTLLQTKRPKRQNVVLHSSLRAIVVASVQNKTATRLLRVCIQRRFVLLRKILDSSN